LLKSPCLLFSGAKNKKSELKYVYVHHVENGGWSLNCRSRMVNGVDNFMLANKLPRAKNRKALIDLLVRFFIEMHELFWDLFHFFLLHLRECLGADELFQFNFALFDQIKIF
jgi:hypothetical protein